MSNIQLSDSVEESAQNFFIKSVENKYSYNFEWLGRPIIQYPQDIMAMQELIWNIRPDLIIETGIAHGGSLIMSASILALIDYCDAVNGSQTVEYRNPRRKVLGIDIDIRSHNRIAIESHPLAGRIEMLQGSSVAPDIVESVWRRAEESKSILVCLDSNHSHDHVLAELNAYAPLVTAGSYCVVFDTAIENLPANLHLDRNWGPGNSPKSAVNEYLKSHPEFMVDKDIDRKLLVSVAKDGYLKRL